MNTQNDAWPKSITVSPLSEKLALPDFLHGKNAAKSNRFQLTVASGTGDVIINDGHALFWETQKTESGFQPLTKVDWPEEDEDHEPVLCGVFVSPCGEYLLHRSSSGIRLFGKRGLGDWVLVKMIPSPNTSGWLSISIGGRSILGTMEDMASGERSLLCWEGEDLNRVTTAPNDDGVVWPCASDNGALYAHQVSTSTIQINRFKSRRPVWTVNVEGNLEMMVFSSGGKFLATACSSPRSAEIWDVSTESRPFRYVQHFATERTERMFLSIDGSLLVINILQPRRVEIINAQTTETWIIPDLCAFGLTADNTLMLVDPDAKFIQHCRIQPFTANL